MVNVYAPAIAKCLQENLSTSDLQPVSNKEMSTAYRGIRFCKEKAKTFAQLLLHWDHGMNNNDRNTIFVTSQISTRLRRSRQQVSNTVSLLSMMYRRDDRYKNYLRAISKRNPPIDLSFQFLFFVVVAVVSSRRKVQFRHIQKKFQQIINNYSPKWRIYPPLSPTLR